MTLFGTATAWLVEPAETTPEVARPPRAATGDAPLSRIAVLGSPAAVPPLAAAVALACRARARVPSALVARWRADGDEDEASLGAAGPALPGAAGFAARLSRRGLPVTARGRLVWLELPPGCDEAVPMLRHAEAAAGDAPVVLAVARPRDAGVDAVLAERDLLVVAARPGSPLAALAGADVGGLGVPMRACAPLPPGALRLATLAGLRGPRLDLWSDAPATIVRLPGPAPNEEAW